MGGVSFAVVLVRGVFFSFLCSLGEGNFFWRDGGEVWLRGVLGEKEREGRGKREGERGEKGEEGERERRRVLIYLPLFY